MSTRIAVIGTGYVGLTIGACLAGLGHRVVCADDQPAKVERLRRGEVPIREPGLAELVAAGLASGALEFTAGTPFTDDREPPEVVFLCVPTPMAPDGSTDLEPLERAVADLRAHLPAGCVLVIKSTVPVGTNAHVARLLARDDVAVVSNPEFLREAHAVHDFTHPDRVVVGSAVREAAERVAALYAPPTSTVLVTDAASAELVKYAANCFLAMRLSYVNAVAELCDRFGADIADVAEGMGLDPRIGLSYLRPGPGWGGSCLPKDIHALRRSAESVGVHFPLLEATIDGNHRQRLLVVAMVEEVVGGVLAGARIGLLGLAFKAGTDDLRDSPALAVARLLADRGAELTGYDPAVPEPLAGVTDGVRVVDDAHQVAKDADALVLLTEWPQFRDLDWTALGAEMGGSVVVDTRNHLDPEVLDRAGLRWRGIGRPGARMR